jgi:TatD DNase family protein
MPEYQDIDEVLSRAKAAGLEFIIDVGFDIASSEKSTTLSANSDFIFTAIGVHPHDAKSFNEECYKKITELIKRPKVVALGEIGLDYHYNLSSQDEQKRMFSKLLWTARDAKLPVIFHGRESYNDMVDIVKSEGQGKVSGVFHSFAGTLEELKWILDNGFYISISGMITFKKAKNIIEITKTAPMDRILIETDCPYLTPEPYRGKRNEPSYVKYVAEALAKVKGMTVDEIGEITTRNAKVLFKI